VSETQTVQDNSCRAFVPQRRRETEAARIPYAPARTPFSRPSPSSARPPSRRMSLATVSRATPTT